MIRAVLIKDLWFLARCASFRVWLAVYLLTVVLASLALYADAGGAGTQADVLLARQQTFQWVLLSLAVPWGVSRFLSLERGDLLVRLTAQTGLKPSEIVLGKMSAFGLYSTQLLVLSAPITAIAYLSESPPASAIVWGYVELLGLAVFAVVVTFHWSLRCTTRLASWMASSLTTVGAAAGYNSLVQSTGEIPALVILAGLTIAGGVLLLRRANHSLLYLGVGSRRQAVGSRQ